MSIINMTKAQMVDTLAGYGETAPPAWTKVQLMARLAELKEMEQRDAPTSEKDVVKEINRCKTRADLRALMDKKGLEWEKNQTIADLKKILFEVGMRQVIPGDNDSMGFGKYAHLTYGEVYAQHSSYRQWCVQTMEEEDDCHWRLKRFATWARNVSTSEAHTISCRIQSQARAKAAPKFRLASRGTSSAPSVTTQSSEWEVTEDRENMSVEALSPEEQIEKLETQLQDLRRKVGQNKANRQQ